LGHMEITIIGTGSGIGLFEHSHHDQAGPSVLIEVDGDTLLFDVGRSALQNVFKSKHNPAEIDHLFLTHLHSDHTVGLPDLVISPWVAYKRHEWRVYGPEGTGRMLDALFGPGGGFDDDIVARCRDLKLERPRFDVTEITQPGTVCEGEGWEVTASFSPKHIQPHLTSIAFRVNSPGGSVVYTGDTGPHEDVVEFAKGCSVLIHDCAIRDRTGIYAERLVHTDPESLGWVAERSGAKTIIAFHFKDRTPEEIELMREKVEERYSGRFIVAEDLLRIDVAKGVVI
jgi:ribonuclease Z